MNHKKIEQIKALLETGFTEHQVKDVLNATDDELLVAMGVDEQKEEPQEEPTEEPVEEPQEETVAKPGSGPLPKFTEEIFNEAKRLRAEGYSVKDIAKKIGFSASFLYSVIGKESYEDVIKLRAKQADYKRIINKKKRRAKKTERVSKPKTLEFDPSLVELRSIADSLQRIAEALERKRGLFGR